MGGETRLDLLFSFALGKVKKDCSYPQWERKSWGIATVLELAMFLLRSGPARFGAVRESKTDSGTFFIHYSRRSSSPTEGDQEPTRVLH